MDWLALKVASWLIHALVVMVSVAAVSPRNPKNTLRARSSSHSWSPWW